MKIVADENIPLLDEAFGPLGEVRALPADAITAGVVADADALIVRSVTQVNRELLEGSSVRFVATATIGVDHVDRAYLAEAGVGFTSAAGSNARSVAEYVLAALTTLAAMADWDLREKTLGIVGVGNIGSRLARMAEAVGMTVLRNDPPLARETGDAKYRPLEELFGADILTFHVPLTREGPDATHHLVDEALLRNVQCGTVLVNSSRGAVVETEAIKKAIGARHLGAVVLDVWENEPEIDLDLLDAVELGTPHVAGYSLDGKVGGTRMCLEAVCEHFGIDRRWDPAPLMPPPAVPRLELPADVGPGEALRRAVASAYDIRADDEKLRGVFTEPPDARGAYFKALRKNYHVRREFPQTTVVLAPGTDPEVARVLEAVDFPVAGEGGLERTDA